MAFFIPNSEMCFFLEGILDRFAKEGRPNLKKNISIQWICYPATNPQLNSGFGASWLNQKPIYPASVVKVVYACAVEAWLENDLIIDCFELRRALSEMIANSSNDATSYIVDLLTGTSSGPSLKGDRWELWKEQRNLVNNWLKTLNWPELISINCSQKTWSDGPYGRDKDFYGDRNQNRNSMTTEASGRIMEAIMTNNLLSSQATMRLKKLLHRSLDLVQRKSNPENQIDGFLGEGLPKGSELWSKAGLMSEARHDLAWFITPNGKPMLLAVFCEGRQLANDNFLLPALSGELSKWKIDIKDPH